MSKIPKTIFLAIIILFGNFFVFSQDVEIKIGIIAQSTLKVEGILKDETLNGKNWLFLRSYADAENLDKRIKNVRLFDKDGKEINYAKLADWKLQSERSAKRFSYEVDVILPKNVSLTAHVSWLGKSHGLLMLNDLLPTFNKKALSANIVFNLPLNWRISSKERRITRNTFFVNDLENAIFLVGDKWREKDIKIRNTNLQFSIYGKWEFEDLEAFLIAEEIFTEYANLFGEIPVKNTQIFLLPFPRKVGFERWRAETRGGNITIMSAPTTFKSAASQRLHEQVRHEILHLWIPNGLNLTGDYAWFYEGFIIYQALKTGVWLGRIRFGDFLNTLEYAYRVSNIEGQFSLIEMSGSRWRRQNAGVYSKGMVIAFLCDIALLKNSKGKRSLANIFRELYQKHNRSKSAKNANDSVIKVLEKNVELREIIKRYIKGKEKIVLANYLAKTGIKDKSDADFTSLELKIKLRKREKALLKKLGYNRWRKLLRK